MKQELLDSINHGSRAVLQRSFKDLRRSIFVFIFGSFSEAEESSKLRRFKAKDCEDFMGKFNNILDKIVWKIPKICTFLKTLNFNFPHIILSSTAGKSCSSCCLKENFYQRKFFIFLWKSLYLRRYSKNLQSLKIFEEFLN